MTDSQSPTNAGSNEAALDSQAVLEAYTAEFGVATLKSTRSFKDNPQQQHIPLSGSWPNPGARDAPLDAARLVQQGPAEQHAPPDPDAATAVKDGTGARARCSTNLSAENDDVNIVQQSYPRDEEIPDSNSARDGALNNSNQSIKLPNPTLAPPRKMDFSQQTPTQVNDDRDYSEYYDVVPSSPVTQQASNEPQSLQPDDTGVVNFGLSEPVRPSSQVSEDAGFENTRGDWRRPEETPQLNSSTAFTPFKRPHGQAFETPALPKNPFAAKGTVAPPLAGSQLFGQSQFSSAVKKISPTSSRPSPNLFNSFSPQIVETSPLKNRANVSSPTDIRTSSPQRLHEIPHTSLRDKDGELDEAGTPLNSRSTGGEMIPESPPSSDRTPIAQRPQSPPMSSETKEPMAHYVPMKKSQERKSSGEPLVSPLDSDSDSDDAVRRMERRKKVERKRARAAEEMGRASFIQRDRSYSGEKPTRKRRRVMSTGSTIRMEISDVKPDQLKGEELPPLVGDSQNAVVTSNETLPFASTKATPGENTPDVEEVDEDGDTAMEQDAEKATVEEERIPATSPVSSLPPTAPQDVPQPPASEPDLPILRADGTPSGAEGNDGEPSSLPPQRRTTRTYGRATRQRRRNPFISSSYSDGITTAPEPKPQLTLPTLEDTSSSPKDEEPTAEPHKAKKETAARADEVVKLRSSKRAPSKTHLELPPPMTTRSRRSDTSPVTPLASRPQEDALATSSSLSELSSTPRPSAKTTPGTQESPSFKRTESVSLASPAKGRSLRKKDSASPQPSTRQTRMSKRSLRLDSDSTDELHHSPTGSALEKSIVYAKSNRSFRQSIAPVHRIGKLFEGMIFAISFSSQVKPQERTKFETKITQAGGTVLPEGFQDLFEQSSIMNTTSPVIDEEDALQLTETNLQSGFTALIADGHSRKAKYMQALALGLPCLAQKWITTCLNKGTIVDWEPYVLCAGVSTVLGNAIRSRMLVPYSAVDARLAEVVDQRPRLLDGQRILVVVDSRKARSEAKEPYVFLARVLGPSISRVFNVQQAREALQEHQKAGNPFDWLYIDKGTGTVEAVLAPPDAPTGKKRRRSAPATQSFTGNIRVLDDELVIQSLILGRMVEEDDLH
ncbi:hypothetical protein B0T10DRAFT_437012 [Thelonectria olida]|uniref:BRCT domain-containing protein n=1 Tax=Thelonectria olida TaxID=1576542 RepID=A0A9P8W7N8_9HYPO|nr:hypothetical protein B0T10DRAFT_437012 [Thelonectria olida]